MGLFEFEDDDIITLRELDAGKATAKDLVEAVNVHRRALTEVRGDMQRTHERSEKMAAELATIQREVNKGARVEVVPQGSRADFDQALLRDDGSVRMVSEKVKHTLPDGSTFETSKRGLLDSASIIVEMEQFRRAYSAWAIAYHRAASLRIRVADDLLCQRAWVGLTDAIRQLPGKVGDYCRRLISDPAMMQRALNGTAGSGGEMVGVPTVKNIIRPYDLARFVPGLVRMMDAPSPSFKRPIVSGRALGRKRGQTQNDPARYPVQNFSTSDVTTTVVDFVINCLIDPLWVRDAAPLLGDPMAEVMNWIMKGYADTLEAAFLHGDNAATHQDSINGWTLAGYFASGQLGGSDSPLAFWKGWRARAFDDSATTNAGGTWDAADHTAALAIMNNHAGGNVVNIVGLACLYSQLMGNSQFLTVQNYGDKATLLTGEIGVLFGKPVIISEMMKNDLATTGLYTGSGTANQILLVNTDAYEYYELPGDDHDVVYPEKGAQYLGITRRGILVDNTPSGEKPCSVINNL